MDYKVFSFDSSDWVVAKNEEEAKKFYEQFIPRDEVEEAFEGESSLNTTMKIDPNELTASEKDKTISVLGIEIQDDEEFKVSFDDWMKVLSPFSEPFIIASTEY